MTCGKDLNNDPAKVVAVIGDGAMTGGMAYEALNQAGHLKKNLLIILNDNNMSIAPNVGAVSSVLSRTFSKKKVQAAVREFGDFLKSLPAIGRDVYQLAKRSKVSFKSFVTPGMLFEAFNVEYFGPIDGHNLERLIEMLDNLKKLDEPVLLHVKTKKGKDYKPAEQNPVHFHGCSCFDIETGRSLAQKSAIPSYTTVFGSAVLEYLSDAGLTDIAMRRIGIGDTFVEHGDPRLLRSRYGVDATAIVQAAQRLGSAPRIAIAGVQSLCMLN
jgi:1-deoxy-D-xylulose-5-phosphate synthase